MGSWAANITSWMEKQEKKMNTLADINKKRKGKNRGFRQHIDANDLSSSHENWSGVASVDGFRVNEQTGEMRGGPGTSEGESSQERRNRQNEQDDEWKQKAR